MNHLRLIAVGCVTVFLLILVNITSTSIFSSFAEGCTTTKWQEHSSPDGTYSIVYHQEVCGEGEGSIHLLLRDPGNPSVMSQIIRASDQIPSNQGYVLGPVSFGFKWVREDLLEIRYVAGTTAIFPNRAPMPVSEYGRALKTPLHGLQIDWVPFGT